jgi:hypothetical protein
MEFYNLKFTFVNLNKKILLKTILFVFNSSLKKAIIFQDVNIENKKATSERK